MLTRFDTTNGRLAVSAMKPAAMTKARVEAGEKRSASSMEITMGVRISAAPSLANSADTAAPSRMLKANRRAPLPFAQRATCRAAHSKKPASSSKRLMMITAMKVAVAFHTMSHTVGMSAKLTTPAARASTAPSEALQPTPRPRGCQMTRIRVNRKMATAISMGTVQQQVARRAGRSPMLARRLASCCSQVRLAARVAASTSRTHCGRSGARR